MRYAFSGYNTALSAMQANQQRLNIIGQNLSNMNTVGYTRQQLDTSSLNYTGATSHYINGSQVTVGFGVRMNGVSQIRDPYLDSQYRSQMQKSSYNSSLQESLDSLEKIFDESDISGIRKAFDDIKSTLTNMQDISKINDPVYETELRSRMLALTNLLNDSDSQINEAMKIEYDKLDGEGGSEQGAIQTVNDLLRQIGDLNVQIKHNQILGQDSLEMQDERNVLLDELSSYIPIEVTYFKDADHSGTKAYEYDSYGNIIGKKDWPDDLKVELVYTDSDGTSKRLTLVNGSDLYQKDDQGNLVKDQNGNAVRVKNYGSLTAVPADGKGTTIDRSNPTNLGISFTAAESTTPKTAQGSTSPALDATTACASGSQFSGGSIQAGLDMLGKAGTGNQIQDAQGNNTKNTDDVRGYQYYKNQLNKLASTFYQTINDLNNKYKDSNQKTAGNLLSCDPNAAAGTITISDDWINGKAHVSTNCNEGGSYNDTLLEMIKAFSETQTDLGNKSFTDYITNVSTILANDSSTNQTSLTTSVTVLNGIQSSRESYSGVSLDEEATNMMTYSSSYSAAARLMTTMDEMIQTLLAMAQ